LTKPVFRKIIEKNYCKWQKGLSDLRITAVAVSDRGQRLASLMREKSGGSIAAARCDAERLPSRLAEKPLQTDVFVLICPLSDAVRASLSFFGAASAAPLVIVLDEDAKYVIPLCSADSRLAAELTKQVAALLGAIPVLTAGPEQIETFAIDKWAAAAGLRIANPEAVRFIKEKLLTGQSVLYDSVFPIAGALPPGIREAEDWEKSDFSVSYLAQHEQNTLLLVPPVLTLGIDGETPLGPEPFQAAAETFMGASGCHPLALGAVRCAEDCALRETAAAFCEDFGLPFAAVPAEALQADDPRFRAAETECEKCAVLGMDGTLLVRRFSQDGVGFALAVLEPSAE